MCVCVQLVISHSVWVWVHGGNPGTIPEAYARYGSQRFWAKDGGLWRPVAASAATSRWHRRLSGGVLDGVGAGCWLAAAGPAPSSAPRRAPAADAAAAELERRGRTRGTNRGAEAGDEEKRPRKERRAGKEQREREARKAATRQTPQTEPDKNKNKTKDKSVSSTTTDMEIKCIFNQSGSGAVNNIEKLFAAENPSVKSEESPCAWTACVTKCKKADTPAGCPRCAKGAAFTPQMLSSVKKRCRPSLLQGAMQGSPVQRAA